MSLAHVSYDTLSRKRPAFASEPLFKPLVISMAYALDGILTPREGKARMKDAMQKGAVIRTRRVLRSNYRLISETFETLYQAVPKVGERLFPMLGVAMGVAIRLKIAPKQKDADQEPLKDKYARVQKEQMTTIFVERVLGAKSPLPRRTYVSLWYDPKPFREWVLNRSALLRLPLTICGPYWPTRRSSSRRSCLPSTSCSSGAPRRDCQS